MADIVGNMEKWQEIVEKMREFADKYDLQLKEERRADGKRVTIIECWFRPEPKRGGRDEEKS